MKPDYEQERRILEEVSESKSGSGSRYSNFERIGAGGMGVVYRAHDEVLLRAVAIKLILPDRESEEALLQFQSEARATSKCDSPNLVSILDFGLTKSNRPFLIMEYVEGPSLSTVLEENGPFKPETAILLFTQILSGLEHAHKHGIVHGDLKPSNVLLAETFNGQMQAKIVDFGLARFNTAGDGTGKILEPTDHLLGSPYYMSPEQVRGGAPGVRSDIYSIGCLMFATLTGHAPFEGDSVMETMAMHLNDPPIGPGAIDPDCLRFDNLILKCMAKNPDDRYRSAKEIQDALLETFEEHGRENLDVSAAEGSRRLRSAVLLSTVALLAIILLVPYMMALPDIPYIKQEGKKQKKVSKGRRFSDLFYISNSTCHPKNPPDLKDEDLKALRNRSFKCLSLKYCRQLKGNGLKYVIGNQELWRLDLSESSITDDALMYVCQIPKLWSLYLGNTRVTTDGVLRLATLRNLNTLSVRGCKVDGRVVDMALEKMPDLGTFVLSESLVTGNYIPKMKNFKKLTHLHLTELSATPAEWESLLEFPSLQHVSVDRSNISTELVYRLAAKKNMRSIALMWPQLSDDSKARIHKINPNIKVLETGYKNMSQSSAAFELVGK